ncbi:zinc finger FYVE domain containing 19 [Schistosoma japonicum]|nr:zinc finger FYVE domain containing 19 [Schistosoma japonicum]
MSNFIYPLLRVIKSSNLKPNKTNRIVLPDKDPKTDELIKRFKQLKMNQVKAVEDVSLLEYRFRRLKGLTDDKPTSSSIFSLSKTDEVSKLVQQYVEEAQISAECGSDLSLEDDPIKPENLPSCYMCEGIAEFLCKECDDNFCKRCFNKTHNKRERLEHATGMCKL